jgi:hypothetical protein
MPGLWEKLNLGEHREILVVGAPRSFASELKALQRVRIERRITAIKEVTFALVFVVKQTELNHSSAALTPKVTGDAVIWFAYPKGTSKRYACDFNRDTGWDVLRSSGFDTVRQVAIDEDWSALRFRRTEYINHRPR